MGKMVFLDVNKLTYCGRANVRRDIGTMVLDGSTVPLFSFHGGLTFFFFLNTALQYSNCVFLLCSYIMLRL